MAVVLLPLLALLVTAGPAAAAITATPMPQTYVVTSTADDVNDANCTMASCTLRQAVNASNANDPGAGNANTITFNATFATVQTITLLASSGGTLTASKSVTIDATAGNRAVTISGNNAVRLFVVNGGVTLGLHGLILTGGFSTTSNGPPYGGGAIYNNGTVTITGSTVTGNQAAGGGAIENIGTVTITGSTVSNNQAGQGGAIDNQGGTVTITGSTVSGNRAPGQTGGAITNLGSGTLRVTNTTFTNNTTGGNGGAIENQATLIVTSSTFNGNQAGNQATATKAGGAINNGGTVNITGSTFTGNSAGYGGGAINNNADLTLALSVVTGNSAFDGPDIHSYAPVTSGGGNVIGNTSSSSGGTEGAGGFGASDRTGVANPGLGTLGNYGGTVQTIAVLPGSPAIDILACPMGLTSDARGVSRPQGANCDAGAFESRGFAAGMTTGNGQSAAITTQFGSGVGLTVSSANSEPMGGGQVTFTITPGGTGASATFTGTPPMGCTLSAMNTVAVCTIPMSGTAASPTFTANGTAGGFTIVATASGLPPTNFAETNTAAGTAPTAVADSYTAAVNSTLTVPAATGVLANDTLGAPAATITASTQPTHGMVTLSTGDGSFTYTPTAGYTGSDSFTYTLTNSVGVSTATVNLTVTGTVNQPPAITSADHATFTVGTAGTFTVATSGYPAATTVTETGTLPVGVTFTDNGDGTATLAGIPAAGTGGVYALTFTATNATGFTTQGFTLTVNQPPGITSADHATFTVGAASSFTVTTTAGYPTATTLAETGTLPVGVTFTDNGDGTATLAGIPAAGTGGVYDLTITATNAAGNPEQAFTLTVQPESASPVITSADHATFAVGMAGSFMVTTTTGFPTATTITATGTLPAGMTFTDNHNGTATLAGTPAVGTTGSYPLTITASNTVGPTQQAFTLTVGPAAQTITFAPLPDRLYGAAPFAVTANADSGLPVAFTSSTTSVCTLSGSTVTLKAAGTCTITASQAGNGTWTAAAPVTRSFTLGYAVSTLAPLNKTTFQARSTIPVKFQLTGADGKPIPNSLAASLGCTVKVSFNGGAPVCASYNSTAQQFQANVATPANLPRRTSYPIVITVTAGTTTVATATTTVTTK